LINPQKIIGYQIGIKVRHGMKITEFQIKSVTNFVAVKQAILGTTNDFFNYNPK
jgi:hypothetical protein